MRVGPRNVDITNSDKQMFPDQGISKAALVDYYVGIADRMLPHIRGHLLTLVRYPDGIEGKRFFQKNASDYFPDWIERKTVPKDQGRGTVSHVVATEKATLAYLGNQAAIELHMSLSRRDRLDAPDQMIFDLDPSDEDFTLVRKTALRFKDVLEELGFHPVVKTSGSRGLHVVVALSRADTFDEARRFALDLATLMAERQPDLLTVEGRKDKRKGRLFLDWLRNSRGATNVVPYSPRARPGAPVSMPIPWSEVEDRRLTPQRYKMRDALEQGSDPWKGWRRHARSLKEPRRELDRILQTWQEEHQ